MLMQRFITALSILGATWLPGIALSEPGAVDLADTLDFESFHATDAWSIGIGQDGLVAKRTETLEPRPNTEVDTGNAILDASPAMPIGNVAIRETQHHRISNPYSQRPGAKSPTPSDATDRLFRSMAETCPEGWQKDREWTTPTTDGFLLHYEFHCLDNPS